MKIGVIDQAWAGWTSGSEYTRAQLAALAAVKDELGFELTLIGDADGSFVTVDGHPVPVTRRPPIADPGVLMRRLNRLLRTTRAAPRWELGAWRAWLATQELDTILCFDPSGGWWEPSDVATCAWIPDLQQHVLPEMWDQDDKRSRDAELRDWAEGSDLVVLSSEASRRDYVDFAPDLADKARIYRFASRFAFDPSLTAATDLDTVLERYNIDRDFFLVVNQLWRHKNHEAVIEAARIVRQSNGMSPQVVMIGAPVDFRDKSGRYVSGLLARIAEYRLEGRVKLLGFVSDAERDALFRSCKALIQPSRFEGWNTSIEDAKAIGLPVIASAIDVHREQLQESFGFFDADEPAELAELLRKAAALPAGPHFDREREYVARAQAALPEIGRQLHSICQDAVSLATLRGAKLPLTRSGTSPA